MIHEYGHAIETVLDLYNNPKFLAIRDKGLESISEKNIIIDDESFEETIFRIEAEKLISAYQGRLYENFGSHGIYDGQRIYLDGMREYFSEGFRCYFTDPELLERKTRTYMDI